MAEVKIMTSSELDCQRLLIIQLQSEHQTHLSVVNKDAVASK